MIVKINSKKFLFIAIASVICLIVVVVSVVAGSFYISDKSYARKLDNVFYSLSTPAGCTVSSKKNLSDGGFSRDFKVQYRCNGSKDILKQSVDELMHEKGYNKYTEKGVTSSDPYDMRYVNNDLLISYTFNQNTTTDSTNQYLKILELQIFSR